MTQEIHTGWFIRFAPDEKEFESDLMEYMKEGGYSQDAEGLKKMLYDSIYMEDSEEKPNPIMDAIRENPEAIKQTFTGLGNLASQLINKKIFKK